MLAFTLSSVLIISCLAEDDWSYCFSLTVIPWSFHLFPNIDWLVFRYIRQCCIVNYSHIAGFFGSACFRRFRRRRRKIVLLGKRIKTILKLNNNSIAYLLLVSTHITCWRTKQRIRIDFVWKRPSQTAQ
jgi:hypothetical protein